MKKKAKKQAQAEGKGSVTLVVGDLDQNSSDEELAEFIQAAFGSYPDDYDVETKTVKPQPRDAG